MAVYDIPSKIIAVLYLNKEVKIGSYGDLRWACGIPDDISKRAVRSSMVALVKAGVVRFHRRKQQSRYDTDRPIVYWLSDQPVPSEVLKDALVR